MAEKKSFVMYKSWDPMIKDLDDASVGILMKAAFAYQCGYEYEIENPILKSVFQVFLTEFMKNDKSWADECERRKQAAIAREEKKRAQQTTTVQNCAELCTTSTDSEGDSDIERDIESDSDIESDKDLKPSGKRKQSKREVEIVPNYAKDPVLNATILEFLAYRKQMRSSMSDIAVTKMLAKLEKIGKSDHERIEILNQSMENGWKGIFPLDKVKPKNTDVDWEAL